MTRRHAIAPTTTRRPEACDRPFGLQRRQRAASAVAGVVVSCVLLSMIAFGMADSADTPVLSADASTATLSAA